MLPEKLSFADDFPPVGYADWRALVEQDLQGASFERKLVTHTYEGIAIQPVYTREDRPLGSDPAGLPGFAPFTRGSQPVGAAATGWDLRQEHAHPDLRATHRAILDDLLGGATSLQLRWDAAGRAGRDPDDPAAAGLGGTDGTPIFCVEDLEAATEGVHLEMIGIGLDAGAAFFPASILLLALWERRGVALADCRGAFNADPLGVLAREGSLPMPLAAAWNQLAALAEHAGSLLPHVRAVGVDTGPYHDAGATAAQDVAFAASTGLEYLRALVQRGSSVDRAAGQMHFRFSVGTHHFLAIAKLRAARRVWSRILEASGGSPAAGAMHMQVRTSRRVLTRRAPYVNLLRNTAGVFAAAAGGAQVITSAPFDQLIGLPTDLSRRIARNTVLVLQEEAGLHRVVDPAGGSWFLECLTDQLAEKAWTILQEVERQGGMAEALASGWCAAQIDAAYAPRATDIARRKQGITGVSEFPDATEEPLVSLHPDPSDVQQAAADRLRRQRAGRRGDGRRGAAPSARLPDFVADALQGATLGELAAAAGLHGEAGPSAPPLELRSFAEPFEHLRDASDARLARHGARPRVFLAHLGTAADYTARSGYAKNFFEAGGFETIESAGSATPQEVARAFGASGARIAVLCSSDRLYEQLAAETARMLKAAGARSVVLAGRPGDREADYREAGVDRFIFIGCNVLDALQQMLTEEGASLA